MGRAIVRQPQVFCMDEPLSNLDAKLRVQTRTQIASLQRRLGTTTVYVTHDQVEAMTMGDRVAVLKDGVLQQVGTPRAMYDRPVNAFVAGFIGSPAMNLLRPRARQGRAALRRVRAALPARGGRRRPGSRRVTVGVRPEDLDLSPDGTGLAVQVAVVEELGADAYLYGRTTVAGAEHQLIARVDGRRPPVKGETVHLLPRREHLHLFSGVTGERLAA